MKELQIKVDEMAANQAIEFAGSDKAFDLDLLNEEKARVRKLRESRKKLSERLEEAERELKNLKHHQREEEFETKIASFEVLEKTEDDEGTLTAFKRKISSMKKLLDESNAKLRY